MAPSGTPEKHLNLNVRGMPLSATLDINERTAALARQGREVFRLGLGQSPFPVPEPVVEALRSNAAEKDYLPVRGLPILRDAVAEYHRGQTGGAYDGADVLIGPGSKELMFLLQITYYGDLIVPTPAWVSYAPQAQIVGRSVHLLPTDASDGWKLQPAQLDALCQPDPERPRIVVINYPSNPTGGTYSGEELQALAEVADRYKLVLLSDEIYGELHHTGGHLSVARYYPAGTIISSGISKWCGAGGWRLGTFTFPSALRWLLDAMAAVASESYTATSAPIQFAGVRAFQGGIEIERYLDDARRILATLGAELLTRLRATGADVLAPAGGFYLFPDFGPLRERLAARGITTSDELVGRLLADTGVACLPGSAFGRDPTELTARLAYVDFDGAKALGAAATVALDQPLPVGFCETHCPTMLRAIDRLAAWLQAP